MNELIVSLKIALSNTFLMYFKAHSYHWNVEGMNFAQYHAYLGDLYEELHAAVDPMAEELRALDFYGPISLTDLYRTKTVSEDEVRPVDYREMVMNLISCNTEVINSLNKAFELAETENKQGVADFIAGRIDVHNKHGWMLRSFLK